MPLMQLVCVGRDGVARTFFLEYEQVEFEITETWHFRVFRSNPPAPSEDFFDLVLERFDASHYVITETSHHNEPSYEQKGIPDSLIPQAARILGCRIVSSSNRKPRRQNEWRNDAADRYWARLVKRKMAAYDEFEDRFRLPP